MPNQRYKPEQIVNLLRKIEVEIVRAGVKEHHFCRFDEQQAHGRGRGKKLYRSFYILCYSRFFSL
jgi:hypothetical protein